MAASVEPTTTGVQRAFCAAASRERGEPLAATASRIDRWLLVEYRGPWRRDVLDGSLLSPALKTHLRDQLAALGRARLLFVKQPEARARDGRTVFVVSSRPGEERLLRLEVAHHEDIRELDLADALGSGGSVGAPVDGPLLVVCTHGKRDRCCALEGRPLYESLRDAAGAERVWQSTHIGGDRFAGNVAVLPEGLYYGRVTPAETDSLLAAHASGRIDLDHYRGRSAYSFPVQAAEHAVRESTGLDGIGDVTVLATTRSANGLWHVRLRTADGSVHQIDVVETLADEPAQLTCGSTEPRRARRHLVAAHHVLS